MAIGSHRLEYEVVENWERLPEGWAFTEVVGVAIDSRDRVFVFCRGSHPLIIFDKERPIRRRVGRRRLRAPPRDLHQPRRPRVPRRRRGPHRPQVHDRRRCSRRSAPMTASPRTPATIGTDYRTITPRRPRRSTRRPTSPSRRTGELYVTDGYGNARVHKFAADGRLLSPGASRAAAPASSTCRTASPSTGRPVYVADRENSRVQIFSRDGALQDIWDWPNRPCDLFIDAEERIHVAELGFVLGNEPVPHLRLMQTPPPGHTPIAGVTDLHSGRRGDRSGRRRAVDPARKLLRAPRALREPARRSLRRGGDQGDGGREAPCTAHPPLLPEVRTPERLTGRRSSAAGALGRGGHGGGEQAPGRGVAVAGELLRVPLHADQEPAGPRPPSRRPRPGRRARAPPGRAPRPGAGCPGGACC